MRSAFRADVTSSGDAGLRNCSIVGTLATVRAGACAASEGAAMSEPARQTNRNATDGERVMEALRRGWSNDTGWQEDAARA
jgi:hypothetical protein